VLYIRAICSNARRPVRKRRGADRLASTGETRLCTPLELAPKPARNLVGSALLASAPTLPSMTAAAAAPLLGDEAQNDAEELRQLEQLVAEEGRRFSAIVAEARRKTAAAAATSSRGVGGSVPCARGASKVLYRFKHAVRYDEVRFEGADISVGELSASIFKQRGFKAASKLRKDVSGFTFFDEQTGRNFLRSDERIAKDTVLVARRVNLRQHLERSAWCHLCRSSGHSAAKCRTSGRWQRAQSKPQDSHAFVRAIDDHLRTASSLVSAPSRPGQEPGIPPHLQCLLCTGPCLLSDPGMLPCCMAVVSRRCMGSLDNASLPGLSSCPVCLTDGISVSDLLPCPALAQSAAAFLASRPSHSNRSETIA